MVGPLLDEHNCYEARPKEMANLLSQQYQSVFSTPKESLVEKDIFFPEVDPAADKVLHEILPTQDDFIAAISELSPTAGSGPDGYPAVLLLRCKTELSKPLTILWKKCLKDGTTPQSLKEATIIPLHKGNSRGLASNYRPIALTSHIIKIAEKVIRKHIIAHMDNNNLFNPSQHGFRAGRSCLSQLIAHFDRILSLIEEGANVDVIYLDFAKAFDKVDHSVLLHKLKRFGIQGSVGRWIY